MPTQRVAVIDASALAEWAATDGASTHKAPPRCSVLQLLPLDPQTLSGPHLLGVDRSNGDLYAALVADKPRSTVLRYRRAGSQSPSRWQQDTVSEQLAGLGLLVVLCAVSLCVARSPRSRRSLSSMQSPVIAVAVAALDMHGTPQLRAVPDTISPDAWELNPAAKRAARAQGAETIA